MLLEATYMRSDEPPAYVSRSLFSYADLSSSAIEFSCMKKTPSSFSLFKNINMARF